MFFYCISARDYGQRLNKTYPTTFRCNLFQLPSILNLIIINIQAKELPMQSVQEGRHLRLLRKQGLMGTISLQAQDPSPTNDWSTGSPSSRYKWLRGQGVVNTFGCTGSPNNLFVQPIVILQPAQQALGSSGHKKNGRVRRPHVTPRVSPSRAPVLSFTYYFQATTQASDNLPPSTSR